MRLIGDAGARIAGAPSEFLLPVHDAERDFDLIGLPAVADLPTIRWKLLNLRKLMEQHPQKHAGQRTKLVAAFHQ